MKSCIAGLAVSMAFALTACTRGDAAKTRSTSASESPSRSSASLQLSRGQSPSAPPVIKVYKTPTCGCCKEWVKHLEQNGFTVETVDMPDLSMVKEKYGVKAELRA